MKKNHITVMAVVALLGAAVPVGRHFAHAETHEKPQARIPIAEARTTALSRVPGTVVEEDLEREGGKSVYSFEIKPASGDKVMEVLIDANDGSVVSVEEETGEHEDEKEGK